MGIESNQSTPEFDEFVAGGEIETGKDAGGGDDTEKEEKKAKAPVRAPKPAPAAKEPVKPAADDDDDAGDDQGDDDQGDDGEDDGEQKPRKTAADHQIERLKREKRDLQRQLREGSGSTDLARRLENIEKGLSGTNRGDNQNAGTPAPDPSDTEKYPLGHLDDRYIEDKLAWLAKNEATKLADSALQRQQENERNAAIRTQQEGLLRVVDALAAKGSDLFEDFQETVVEAGMRGDYDLSQPTFEACAEADNGPQILYDLSQDPKEASRVAKLTPYGQLKFVQERDAELSSGKRGRTKPQAGVPPKNTARGANSRTEINPATDNLNDFEKAWERDAKKTG